MKELVGESREPAHIWFFRTFLWWSCNFFEDSRCSRMPMTWSWSSASNMSRWTWSFFVIALEISILWSYEVSELTIWFLLVRISKFFRISSASLVTSSECLPCLNLPPWFLSSSDDLSEPSPVFPIVRPLLFGKKGIKFLLFLKKDYLPLSLGPKGCKLAPIDCYLLWIPFIFKSALLTIGLCDY